MGHINKTMEQSDLYDNEARNLVRSLESMMKELKRRNLRYSSWYGQTELSGIRKKIEELNRGYDYEPYPDSVDDVNIPWFLYWEIVWVYLNGGFKKGDRVLDMGGSSSLFSYFLCYRGCDVVTIDINDELVENANNVAARMGWSLRNLRMDMRSMTFAQEAFDHITSICVYEHVPVFDRIEVNRDVGDFLRNNGRLSITFDYLNPARSAQIGSPQDISLQFVDATGLSVRGNVDFYDNGKRYLLSPFYHTASPWVYKLIQILRGHYPASAFARSKTANDYTIGALFLEKSM